MGTFASNGTAPDHQMTPGGRLPDFLVIGTMKSGTTTVFRWLEGHPQVRLPAVKEPNFFADDRRWQRGIGWYSGNFKGIPRRVVTGEASVRYTDPRWSAVAAERCRDTVPGVRLVCVLRDPVQRMYSHYRHEVQRGRERRRFSDAVAAEDSSYMLRSCYFTALSPWAAVFPPNQLYVASSERLLSSDAEWAKLLGFLSLKSEPRPATTYNATHDKAAFSPMMRVLWELGLAQRAAKVPHSIRRLGRRLLLRPPGYTAGLVASVEDGPPTYIRERLRHEVVQLHEMFPDVTLEWDLGS